jgi:hypothetical protein
MRFFRWGTNADMATDDATETAQTESDTDSPESAIPSARGGATTSTSILRDLMIVTYAVPAERVVGALPAGLPAEILPGPEGDPVAFVQVVTAFVEDARWSPLPGGVGRSFHQASYRILTRYEKRRGAFHWRTFVSTTETHATKRALDNYADYARFSFFIDGDPARSAYRKYSLRAVGDLGKTEIEVRALSEPPTPPIPFGSLTDMVGFLTLREDHFADAPLLKHRYTLFAQSHDPLTPIYGEVNSAKLTPFLLAGILKPEELGRPLCVLLQPALTIFSRPPRLVSFRTASVGGNSR